MSKNNIKLPTVEEMLEAGVHFGHQMKRRSPYMDKYIYGVDNKSQIIDLFKTQEQLQKAVDFVYDLTSQGKQIIIVGAKRQASQTVKDMAQKAGLLFVNQRWLGGTFTNYNSIKGRVDRLNFLIEAKKKGDLEKYTKRERLDFDREIDKLEEVVGGIRGVKKYPDALIVVDVKKERVAVHEAKAVKVPVIGLVDTNSDPRDVKIIIPANDDAIKSITLILGVLTDAAIEGYKDQNMEAAKPVAEAPAPVKAEVKEAPKAESKPKTEAKAKPAAKKAVKSK
jgi:small subunit ribosomal protein S2